MQRFGSALNLNVHFHVLSLDGVYARYWDGRLVFHRDRPPTMEDVERLVEQIAEAAEQMFEREGFGREEPCARRRPRGRKWTDLDEISAGSECLRRPINQRRPAQRGRWSLVDPNGIPLSTSMFTGLSGGHP